MTTSPITSINDELLAQLEAAANSADPGPWGWDGPVWCYDAAEEAPWLVREDNGNPIISGELQASEANALYLALANPATIKALLAHIVELRRDSERYRYIRSDGIPDQAIAISDSYYGELELVSSDRLDAAIDAAMQEAKP